MRLLLIFFLTFLSIRAENKRVNYLTESMGQEVIEIGAPIKDLPPDVEEEPSAENDDEKTTATSVQVATKKDIKTSPKILRDNIPVKAVKDVDKIDGRKDDEEARIEKELADLYKDSVDYKADSGEITKESIQPNTTEAGEKPIARARNEFKFQPDSNDPREVARFRTSVDEISCRKSKLSSVTKAPNSGSESLISSLGIYLILTIQSLYIN